MIVTTIEVDALAVLLGAAGAWIVGAIWYGVFGRAWTAALGKTREELKRSVMPWLPMALSFALELLMAYVLATILFMLGTDVGKIKTALIIAFLLWLGFVLTTIAVNNAFAGRKIMLTVIDAGHWLVALLVMGGIIGAFD